METSAPITIIIPVLNRRNLVTLTLDSVKRQEYRPLRVIVVDNGSTDGTEATVAKWAEANSDEAFEVVVTSHSDGGVCGARNHGLTLATSEYVAFFDSDDRMLPTHISRIMAELKKFPDTDLLYFDIAHIDQEGWTDVKRCNDENLMRAHLLHSALGTQRHVARRSLVEAAGGWNDKCLRWNDLELGVRLLLQSPKVRKLTGEPTVQAHNTSISISGNCYFDESLRCERTLDVIDSTLQQAERRLERQWVNGRRATLAAWYAREGHRDHASRLMQTVLNGRSLKDSLKLRAIYTATRLAGHGGALLTTLLYQPPRPKRTLRK